MQELVDFFEGAVYCVPDQVFNYCLKHKACDPLPCPCPRRDKQRYSLSFFTSKELPRRVYFELSRLELNTWLPLKPRPVEQLNEIWDRDLEWCGNCLLNEPGRRLWYLIEHYNGTGIKSALPAALTPHLPVQDVVKLVDAYLPIGKEVPLACWDCVEASA